MWVKYCFNLQSKQLIIANLISLIISIVHSSNEESKIKNKIQSNTRMLICSNPSNNVSGFCSQLHNRNTQPPRVESSKGEVYLRESNLGPNYASTPGGKPTGHPRVMSPSNLASPLHFRFLQIQLIHALHNTEQNFDVSVLLDRNPLEELKWWLSNIDTVNSSPIVPPAPTLFIASDASKTGWGAVY